MDYKKKYLKYKLKYLTAKKLYGGMNPGPDENEEMSNQGVRDRSNALSPEEDNTIIEAMNNLGFEELDSLYGEPKSSPSSSRSPDPRRMDWSFTQKTQSEKREESPELPMDWSFTQKTQGEKREESPELPMDLSFTQKTQGEKREREESPQLSNKAFREEDWGQERGRLVYGPNGEPVTSPAGVIREESDEDKE